MFKQVDCPEKSIDQMMRKHNLNGAGNHTMEFKKRKSADKPASWPQVPKQFYAEFAALFEQVKAD